MSYDIFMSAFHKGEAAAVSISALRKPFEPFVTEVDPTHWRLWYDDTNSCDVFLHGYIGSTGCISGFSINRPCGDMRLWDALAEILRLGPLVLYSDFPPLVSDMSIGAHLPAAMTEGLGPPICVLSGEDIINVLEATG